MHHRLARVGLLVALTACPADNPAAVSLSGVWLGSYTHPTIPGTLRLTLESTDDDFDGTFLLTYPAGLGVERDVTGEVNGTRPSVASVVFTIDVEGDPWTFVGQLTNADLLQGTWESPATAGTEGLFELERQ